MKESGDNAIPADGSRASVRGRGFVSNVLWSFLGHLVGIIAAFIVSPMIIRQLGDGNYGLWVVTTGLVEYYWLIDFGMRSAIIRFVAVYNASGEVEELNQVIATAACYSLVLLPVLALGTMWAAPKFGQWLHIANPVFARLVMVVGTAWGLTSFLSAFTSSLEGLQRFDVISQSTFVGIFVRTIGTLLLLRMGYGVLEMAYMTAGAQILLHTLNMIRLKRIFPALSVSASHVRWTVFRKMIGYGVHSVVSTVGQRILNQSPALTATFFLGERFAGYYANPKQLLDYAIEALLRIGNVSNSRAAELMATGRRKELENFAVQVNRMSLALFLPLAVFLMVYGERFMLVWIRKPEFVAHASGVLLALLPGYAFGLAAQYSVQSILFGIGRHQAFARNILIESLISLAGMWFLIPRYGIAAAAAWNTLLLILNRGILTPALLMRELGVRLLSYLCSVNRPLLAALPATGAAFLLRSFLLPGRNWAELIAAGITISAVYAPFLYLVMPAEDRNAVGRKLSAALQPAYARIGSFR